jgi:glucose/arabinose dehydrogenase
VFKYFGLALTVALVTSPAFAAVVIDPVPTPIAAGTKVRIDLFTRAPVSKFPVDDGYYTRIQSLQSVPNQGGRLFVTDTRGLISVVGADGASPRAWLDITSVLPGFSNATSTTQTGLMSVAFHPNFAGDRDQPGYGVFYTVDTSAPTGTATLSGKGAGIDHDNVIHEFRVADPAAATPTILSQREVLRVGQPLTDHGAGTIAFNPSAAPGSPDYGKLYIGFGDGGGMGDPYANAQDQRSPFGKILRIDPAEGRDGEAYTIPSDNPNAGSATALGEVWASGLRNPQHFSWDKATGRMLISDIGQSQLEEVNVGRAGANYGWPLREGTFARGTDWWDGNVYDSPANPGTFVDPVAQFDHEEIARSGEFGFSAISGAFAYAGSAIPELSGMVVLSELVSGRLFYYDPLETDGLIAATLYELGLNFDGLDTTMVELAGNPYAGGRVDLRLGIDGNGELYLLSKFNGDIFRLSSLSAVPEPATWAMMILGFGAVGGAMRRRRVKISYA